MNYIISLALSIVLGVYLIPKIRDFYIEKSKPLEIRPTNKKISGSENGNNWNEEFFIYLINHSKNPFYDINVISKFPKDIDISILPQKQDEVFLGTRGNRISVGLDFMLTMEDNENELKTAQTVINNIGPGEKIKIKVTINKKNYKRNFNLLFSIKTFSKIPKPILSNK